MRHTVGIVALDRTGRLRWSALLVALLALTSACGDDTPSGGDGGTVVDGGGGDLNSDLNPVDGGDMPAEEK